MPIYEYQCNHCGHRLEVLQKITAAPLESCPKCQHNTLVKKISSPSFRLKGQGWYETDFKTNNQRNIADNDTTSEVTSAVSDNKESS